ncbi:hypothetical protein [Tabrizicola aquatica]|uniref:hypothetical protein n=1 Tax=Tabrizicola aquatica TaxID=909926 RepID=UPI000CD0B603|nr:hypothetical protein [Tabrizicola aquatica]
MALRLFSLVLLLPVTLANVYWASGRDRNVGYIASSSGGRCGLVGGLWPLGWVLPWVFLALGVGSALQLIFRRTFGLSAALLKLHVVHLCLLLALLVVGNSFCTGFGLWSVVWRFSELLTFVIVVMLVPVPILAMQMIEIRKDRAQEDAAL